MAAAVVVEGGREHRWNGREVATRRRRAPLERRTEMQGKGTSEFRRQRLSGLTPRLSRVVTARGGRATSYVATQARGRRRWQRQRRRRRRLKPLEWRIKKSARLRPPGCSAARVDHHTRVAHSSEWRVGIANEGRSCRRREDPSVGLHAPRLENLNVRHLATLREVLAQSIVGEQVFGDALDAEPRARRRRFVFLAVERKWLAARRRRRWYVSQRHLQ